MGCCGDVKNQLAKFQARLQRQGHSQEASTLGRNIKQMDRLFRRADRILSKMPAQEKRQSQWEDLPRGWSTKSARTFWKSVGGSVSKCIEKLEGVEEVTDKGAFCASLKDRMEGPAWRKEKRT